MFPHKNQNNNNNNNNNLDSSSSSSPSSSSSSATSTTSSAFFSASTSSPSSSSSSSSSSSTSSSSASASPTLKSWKTFLRSKITLAFVLRTAIIALINVWLFYITAKIYREFENRETIIYLEYRTPNTSKPPAITICSHCILCDTTIPFDKIEVRRLLEANDTYPILYRSQSGQIEWPSLAIDCLISSTDISGLSKSHPCDDLVRSTRSLQEGRLCVTYFNDIRRETSAEIWRKSINRSATRDQLPLLRYDHFPHIDFVITGYLLPLSSSNKINNNNNNNNNNTRLLSEMANRENEIDTDHDEGDGDDPKAIYFSVHDPDTSAYMLKQSFRRLHAMQTMSIPFEKRMQQLLPAPYKPGCANYRRQPNLSLTKIDAKQNLKNRTLNLAIKWSGEVEQISRYESRGECYQHCMWRTLDLTRGCANIFSIYTETILAADRRFRKLIRPSSSSSNEIRFCNKTIINNNNNNRTRHEADFWDYEAAKAKCLRRCASPCFAESFEMQNAMIENVRYRQSPDDHSPPMMIAAVTVKWAIKPIEFLDHRPKWDLANFLGALGGHAHIWLGISAVRALIIAVAIVRRLRFRC